MLGEDHSLVSEFPEHKETIAKLSKVDRVFADDSASYDALDKKIRNLELKNAPIDDEAMHQLKVKRANLKDSLYRRLSAT